jgi:hypothetical protein
MCHYLKLVSLYFLFLFFLSFLGLERVAFHIADYVIT